ncbi:hypothetical protein BDA96_08G206400 [Sorghum bicolor]|uniref:Uncharacterized protein n=1 Tax=Sorghum bicolor TaxID=4558 RepID=A0A921QGW9_SORBI|nr:hypothetical protein BDA96_08G206400 [Sorghum bicolor]
MFGWMEPDWRNWSSNKRYKPSSGISSESNGITSRG